jgi:hypothetical protein
MLHPWPPTAKFFHELLRIDERELELARSGGCPGCGGRLDRADYPRKPRGELGAAEAVFGKRFSLCCSRDGCRQRRTPPSVRFLGRRVYVGALVVLASVAWVMLGDPGARSRVLGAPRRTVRRWIEWWQGGFIATDFWKTARARLMPPVIESELPASLLARFDAAASLEQILLFVRPITTRFAGLPMAP